MALVNKPDESIFASSAKQGEVDNFPDLLRGWGISFEQTGGIPPMEWFNFLFKRLDEKHTYLMQRGLPEWSATQDYPAGAFVQYQGLSYKALRTNKNSPPSASNSADWQRWGFTLTEIAKASLTQQGIVQLNSATNSDNETMAATPKAVKTAYDLANGKQSPATTLAGYGIGNFKVEPFVGNLNTLKTDGVYAITQASRSQNLPVSTSCQIEVIAGGDSAWCRQLAYVAYSTDMYERHQTSYQTDSWSPWVKIDSLDKIPNSKKSSAVDSDSADTVATSAAVKIAYDKGVEAKTAADGAQSTANDGVAKAKTAQAAAEAAQRTANDGVSKATTAQNTANSAVTKADNAQRAADNANNNANNRVSKSGDTMTGNLTVPNLIVNDPTNNNNFVQIGDDTKLIDVDMVHTVGLQAADNANDAYIAYGATKKRFGFDGVNFTAESGLGAQWFGSQKRGEGAYVNQWRTEAPYHVQAGNANGSNTYFPYLKGKVTNGDGWGAAFSFGYTTPGTRNQFGTGIIHLIEDNGSEKKWEFAHNGNFSSAADVVTGSGKSLNNTHQQSYDYVQVTGSVSYGGLSILKPDGKSMRFEREGNAFKFWCQDMYSILMPQRGGTVLLDNDFFYQRIGNFEIRKYPDGTMIQTYAVEIANKNTQKWSEHFNWAVAFASTPTVIPILAGITDDTNATDTYILYNKTLSSNTKCVYHTHEYSWHGTKLLAEFTAIGRWK